MIYVAAAGLILGALATFLLQRTEIKYLRDELRVAHAQIAHAVIHEGAEIPARYEEPEPIKPLSQELQACVDQWEDVDSRATEEAKIRQWQAEDWGTEAILRQYGALK